MPRLERKKIMSKLDGKVAVITGGSTGMGLATAKLFVKEGAQVVIAGCNQASLDRAVAEMGSGIEAVQRDIANLADSARL
jgi:NAD(P)-dependent dehydrogenase (short-subunit alcohol dehydrogenase family)